MSLIRASIKALRPKQWSKNGLLLVAMVFAQKYDEPDAVVAVGQGLLIFCMLSSAGYLVNDIRDIDNDRHHPDKKHRPLASGQLSVGMAWALVVVLVVGGLGGSWVLLPTGFLVTAAAYLFTTLTYSARFKHSPILDVMGIAAGFILRAVAGAEAISVESSPWFLTCIAFGALFIGLSKRLAEIKLLDEHAGSHRRVLEEYSVDLLRQLITVTTACSLISYALYTFDRDPGRGMMLTIPFVIYGVFRYLYLVDRKNLGGEPSAILLGDRPMQLCMLLFFVTAVCSLPSV
ncbi:MAG: decaprenyl-phosphate phosphoribosyltransferase [Myxococcota bacterium]|nr:decaprenyl-phosphate phosphoribosyltransferase [Myxococcota bacterium]